MKSHLRRAQRHLNKVAREVQGGKEFIANATKRAVNYAALSGEADKHAEQNPQPNRRVRDAVHVAMIEARRR